MRAFGIEDFCQFKFLSGVSWSPEGKSAAFVVAEADKKANDYKSYIWLYRDGGFRKLTSQGKEFSFQYLDEDTILFPGKRDNADEKQRGEKTDSDITTRYYKISLSGGEAELAYSFPIEISKLIPIKNAKGETNGDLILVGRVIPGFENLYKGDKKYLEAYKKHVKENADYEVIEQSPWWWNGTTYTKGAYNGIFRYDAKKQTLTWLSKKDQDIESVKLSKDGKYAYCFRYQVKPKLTLMGGAELCRIDVRTGRTTVMAAESDKFFMSEYEIADDFIILTASEGTVGLNTNCDFYKLDYESKAIEFFAKHERVIGANVNSDIRYGGGRSWKAVGNTLYYISTRFESANLYKLDEGGKEYKLTDVTGSVDCFDVVAAGDEGRDGVAKILAIALLDMKGQELYAFKDDGRSNPTAKDAGKAAIKNINEGKAVKPFRQLSKFNAAALRDRYVARPERLFFKTKGHEIHGFVLKPMNYNPRKKYPVILDIHGGPKTVYGEVFYHEMQLWAGRGYFVIYCNPTGSDGRGDAFSDIRGKYGAVDYSDIMAFLDKALANYPSMDKKRLYETGGSYGGFMTNWIVGHTNRFRAVASQRSISNWFSMYGVSDIGVEFTEDQNKSDPWNDPEKLWSHSPLKYADKVKTPVLFIHSFEDYRCPIDQAYQMFTALVKHGVETKLVCFRGENHELSRSGKPLHRIKRLTEITEWFDKHR